MVKTKSPFPVQATRSFLEGLAPDLAVHRAAGMTVVIKAGLLLGPYHELADLNVKFEYATSTGNITIRTGGAIEDLICLNLQGILGVYHAMLTDIELPEPPSGTEGIINTLRVPPRHSYQTAGVVTAATNEVPISTRTPPTADYVMAINNIAMTVKSELASFPTWRVRLMRVLRAEFGATITAEEDDFQFMDVRGSTDQ